MWKMLRKFRYFVRQWQTHLFHKPTSDTSAHLSPRWICWGHRPQGSCQPRCPGETAPGECGRGNTHYEELNMQMWFLILWQKVKGVILILKQLTDHLYGHLCLDDWCSWRSGPAGIGPSPGLYHRYMHYDITQGFIITSELSWQYQQTSSSHLYLWSGVSLNMFSFKRLSVPESCIISFTVLNFPL